MPGIIDGRAHDVLLRPIPTLPDGAVVFSDSQGQELPPTWYDHASGLGVQYDAGADHRVSVDLGHARGEAEGNARKNCANDLREGTFFTCDVTTASDGTVLTTRVTAMRPEGDSWMVVARDEVADATPGRLWFERSVKAVHSKTFVSYVREQVRTPELTSAEALWQVPVHDLQELATDPELVIPRPPKDAKGCEWTLPGTGFSC